MVDIQNIVVTRKQLAEILGYENEASVTNLVSLKGAPKVGYSEYPLIDFLKWYIRFLKASHKKKLEKSKTWASEVNRYNAEIKKLQLQEKKKELLPKDEVEQTFLFANKIIIDTLEGMPAKVAAKLVGIDDQKKMTDELKKIVGELRDFVADQFFRASTVYTDDNKKFESKDQYSDEQKL